MSVEDMIQFAGLAGTVLSGVLGYGRLQERVESHENALEGVATKESLVPFQEEVLRRLERIERNQDLRTGSSS